MFDCMERLLNLTPEAQLVLDRVREALLDPKSWLKWEVHSSCIEAECRLL